MRRVKAKMVAEEEEGRRVQALKEASEAE